MKIERFDFYPFLQFKKYCFIILQLNGFVLDDI